MACRLFGAKPLPEPMLAYCRLDFWQQISVKFESEFYHIHSRKCIWKYHLPMGSANDKRRYYARMAAILSRGRWVSSLALKMCCFNFRRVIFKLVLKIGFLSSCCKTDLSLVLHNLIGDRLKLVWVMARFHQATSLYLHQCWPSSMMPYVNTRPQWV